MALITRRTALQLGLSAMSAAIPGIACAQPDQPDWRVALVGAARKQIGVTRLYDPAYVRMAYPGGDVPVDRGVCTDVVIRAYRAAFRMDLQKLVHEDMKAHFAAYPKAWAMKATDPNIDHRRVPNLAVYFTRSGAAQQMSGDVRDYQPGDLVTQLLPGNLPHIVVVSSGRSAEVPARPLVIQNIGQGTKEDDTLFAFPRMGHFRFPPTMAAA